MVLHVHKELTDDLDLISIAKTLSTDLNCLVLSLKQVIIWYFLLNKLSFDTFY